MEERESSQLVSECLSGHEGGCQRLVKELIAWCAGIIDAAQDWQSELQLTSELRKDALVLPKQDLDLISCYQTTSDNQLFKVLKEYREQQAWRIKTLDLEAADLDRVD